MHRQRAVLPERMLWSFLLDWTSRLNALEWGDSGLIVRK